MAGHPRTQRGNRVLADQRFDSQPARHRGLRRPVTWLPIALILGLMGGAALMSAGAIRLEAQVVLVEVPAFRIGDRFSYAVFLEDVRDPELEGFPRRPQDLESLGPEPDGHIRASVTGTTETLDQWGVERRVLTVEVSESYAGEAWRTVDYVDLERRQVVRSDLQLSNFTGIASLQLSHFGPHQSSLWSYFYAGMPLAVGTQLSEWATLDDAPLHTYATGSGTTPTRRSLAVTMSESEAPSWFGTLLVEPETWVAAQGRIAGADVVEIRSEARLASRPEATLWAPPLANHTLYGSRSEWVSGSSSMPLLVREEFGVIVEAEPVPILKIAYGLQHFEKGTQEIAWLPPRQAASRPGPSEGRPGEASGDLEDSRLPYLLDQALADVEGPLKPPELAAWERLGGRGILVSAELRRAEVAGDGRQAFSWRLAFGRPEGAGFEVSATRTAGFPLPLVESRGERPIPAFKPGDLPPDPLRMAAYEALWRRMTGQEANYVHWGFEFSYRSGPGCVMMEAPVRHESRTTAGLRRVIIGVSTEGACTNSDGDFHEAAVNLDAISGRILGSYEASGTLVFTPGSSLTTDSGASSSAPIPADGGRPLLMGLPLLTSGSLLLLVAAAIALKLSKSGFYQVAIAIAGYARLGKEQVLRSRIRQAVYHAVRAEPGITLSDLRRRLKIGWGTTVYHAGVLVRSRFIESHRDGRFHRLFPADPALRDARPAQAALKHPRTLAVYEALVASPGIPQDRLAEACGVSPSTLAWHLRRLLRAGVVASTRRGRFVLYAPASASPKTPP